MEGSKCKGEEGWGWGEEEEEALLLEEEEEEEEEERGEDIL
jgi:hypothetical protein